MIGLVVMGAVGLALFIAFGILGTVLSLVFSLVLLPFKLLGLAFRAVAFLVALPVILLLLIGGGLVFGTGVLLFLTPLFPLALIGLGVWWLLKRGKHTATV